MYKSLEKSLVISELCVNHLNAYRQQSEKMMYCYSRNKSKVIIFFLFCSVVHRFFYRYEKKKCRTQKKVWETKKKKKKADISCNKKKYKKWNKFVKSTRKKYNLFADFQSKPAVLICFLTLLIQKSEKKRNEKLKKKKENRKSVKY